MMHVLVHLCINQQTKIIEVPSTYIIGAEKFKMGHVTFMTPLFRMICPLYVVQNLIILASVVLEIRLMPTKI